MVSFRFDKNRFIVTGCKGDLLAVLRDVACIVNQLSNKETADGIECAKPIFFTIRRIGKSLFGVWMERFCIGLKRIGCRQLFQVTLSDKVCPFDEHEKEYPMKLYIYDHCPFCVRARMAAGLFGADVEEVVMANDDEATPIGMIGAKQVPILQKEDGSFMGESLDVVRYLDREGRLKDETRPEIQAWLDKVGEYNLKLVQPRVIKLGLPEFETPEAVKYFTDKKEKSIGSFAANLEKTGQYVQRLNGDLAELETLMAEGGAGLNGEIGMEDILVFPILRNLTVVRGVEWPQKVMDYLLRMSEASGVPLYFDRAL